MVDWNKLAVDLSAARRAALDVPFEGDGGSANLDSPTIHLKGAKLPRVLQAARAANLSCHTVHRFGTRLFLFSVPRGGQGAHRTKEAEAMVASLKANGWDASMWWQVD